MIRTGFLVLISLGAFVQRSHCAEIRVMCSGAFADALIELIPGFEHVTEHKIVTVTTSMGVGQNYIPTRVRNGEPVDVVLLPDDALNQLLNEGRIKNGSRTPLARSAIGMAVRAGALKPDISSVEALKRTLLAAKSIAYSSQVSGQYLSTELFPRLGVADQIRDKAKRIEGERVGAVVARGEAEIGFQQISELIGIKGIDYVGPLPSEVQRVTLFSAGIAGNSKNVQAGEALIQFLASTKAAATVAKAGLEPIALQ